MPNFLKEVIYRNEKLRRAVAKLPCVCCGLHGFTQCAHIGGVAEGKGMGIKVPDTDVAALCTLHPNNLGKLVDGCHEKLDRHEIDPALGPTFIARTFRGLLLEGLLVVRL